MATVNTIKTRILNKYDVLSNYSSFTPLKGEICVAEIPTSASESGLTPPAIGIKVGDGQKSFSALPWIQAVAGDIPSELKTAAGIDAQIAALTSGRKLATASELSALATRVTSLETRTTDSTIGNEALSTRINTLSNNKVDKTAAEDATTEDKLIKYSTASGLASTAKSEAVQAAASSAAGLYEKIGVAETKVNELANGQVKTNTTNISANATAIEGIQEDIGDISTFVGDDVSTAIKNLQTAVGTGADGLATKVSALEGEMDEVQGALTGYTSSKTVASAVADAKSAGTTAQTQVGTLGSLETEVKTSAVAAINEVHGELDTAKASLTSVTGQVNTLVGSDTGKSVREIAAAETAKIVDGAPDAYNTLKEISDWIAAHPEDAASYASRIDELKTALGGTGSIADGFTITPVSDQIDTKINTYNTDIAAKTYATIANLQKVSEDLAEVKTTADGAVQDVATGSANGTISVDGTDVAVKGLGSAAYTNANAYATSAQGGKADTAIQTASFAGTDMTKNGTALSISQTAARSALGLGTAAYKADTYFGTAEAVSANATAISNMNGSLANGNGLVETISQTSGKISATRRLIKPADVSTAETDVFVFYCGNATGYDAAMNTVNI